MDFGQGSYQIGSGGDHLDFVVQNNLGFVEEAPLDSNSPGKQGDIYMDDSYFYFYGETGWRRIAGSVF